MKTYMRCDTCEAESFADFQPGYTFAIENENGDLEMRFHFPWNGHHYDVRDERVDPELLCRGTWEVKDVRYQQPARA